MTRKPEPRDLPAFAAAREGDAKLAGTLIDETLALGLRGRFQMPKFS